MSLNGVRNVRKEVADSELRGQPHAERADPEGLGRVVAGGEEVDPRLARVVHHWLAGLARDEGVQARRDRVVEMFGRAPGDDPDRPDLAGAGEERQRLAATGRFTHARAKLLGRDGGQLGADPDPTNGSGSVAPI